jgi:serine/threonine protein kinase
MSESPELTPSGRTPVADPLVGTMLTHRFRLEERIAAGGFGAIYRATHMSTGQAVAIKVLHPEWASNPDVVTRFRREGATLTTLRHPHTVTTLEFGETAEGTLYIVMEMLRGETLYERFKMGGTIEPAQIVTIARAICCSLAEAHALGIIHRDLKPANIHLGEFQGIPDFVKVLDFGIAKIMRGSNLDDGMDLTNVGQMIGTFDYMSPEQILGGQCSSTSDIYTLGVMMYEMMSGTRPFAESPGPAMVAALLTSKPPRLSERMPVAPELERIVMRCLAREPQDRYQHVAELASDLAHFAESVEFGNLSPTGKFVLGNQPTMLAPSPIALTPSPVPIPMTPATNVERRIAAQPTRLARGSQQAFSPGHDQDPDQEPTVCVGPPGGVWRTRPSEASLPPYVPTQEPLPQRGSMMNLPRFEFDATRDAWVGRLVWIAVLVLAIVIGLAIRAIVT